MKTMLKKTADLLKKAGRLLKHILQAMWKSLSHNLWMKLLSLVLAISLWSIVIAMDPTLTRIKTANGLTGYLSGQTTLEANKLALAEDPAGLLKNITVRVEVPRSEYAYVSSDNIHVALDLSSVRGTGPQQVLLRASTVYGRVTEIIPSSVTLNFERLDSRQVPVNIRFVGNMEDDLYYTYTRMNPSSVTVSGASSIVQSAVSAYVYDDVSGKDTSYTSTEKFVLLDGAGEEISQSILNTSASSISVSVGIYPTKELPVSTNAADILKGQLAEGYVVQGITIQPETITVAADAELLDGLSSLLIEPLNVQNASQSFSTRARITSLADFKYISSEQVYVNVSIAEETVTAWINDINISFVGRSEGLTISNHYVPAAVCVSGPKSKIAQLQEQGLNILCDLTGLEAGSHELSLDLTLQHGADLVFEPGLTSVFVTLSNENNN